LSEQRFVSNEEYMERWEAAAPTPVHTEMTPEEIAKVQGTRNSDEHPADLYDAEMDLNDPALLAAIDEYAKNVSDAKPSGETEETLARLKEESDNAAEEYQWVTPEEYKNAPGERIGRVMHSSVFISKLRKSGIKCWYRKHPHKDKVTLVAQVGELPPQVACWVQLGFMTELSIMSFDSHGVPLAEKFRGWRTCLLQLILHGIISQAKAEEVFGVPPVTPAFHRYNSTLQRFRNAGSKLAGK
jgi:hypothetical protein